MFIEDRDSARQFFYQVWNKYNNQKIQLEALEQLVLGVILEHPEYHGILQNQEEGLQEEYTPEMGLSNPFLHMGMHIALKEQIGADRPAGIKELYQELLKMIPDDHLLEHKMMESLGEAMWLAQRNNRMPDEQAYMESLRKIKS